MKTIHDLLAMFCSCPHELELARIHGMLGSFDANTGDAQTGWDTDQFLVDVAEATLIMLTVIKNVSEMKES